MLNNKDFDGHTEVRLRLKTGRTNRHGGESLRASIRTAFPTAITVDGLSMCQKSDPLKFDLTVIVFLLLYKSQKEQKRLRISLPSYASLA